MSQFKKIEQDIRNSGQIKWKHAMHLLRLLLTGAATLREARVPVCVEAHRERLLAIIRGEIPWAEVDAWRKELHRDFESALSETKLPERPDYEAANQFLLKARREMVNFPCIRAPAPEGAKQIKESMKKAKSNATSRLLHGSLVIRDTLTLRSAVLYRAQQFRANGLPFALFV